MSDITSIAAISPRRLLNVSQAAELLGVSASYLNKLRCGPGSGVPFVKIGARVAYDPADLEAWIEAQKRRPQPAGTKVRL